MLAYPFAPTLTGSLATHPPVIGQEVIGPIPWQQPKPHVEVISEVETSEACPGMEAELPIQEIKDLCDIPEPPGPFYLDIPATQ